ncbi:MAG TPA: crossover junction endodeoxyribonuclease RuvC, partial [Candidatus Dormibacteraeota bacterium]|nr:crossover junction endodeoxyribonuclease RuvC [Candidatus Dormibacteraeota bacterium]
MIILGIDPGTAALGYGVVERTGGRLRAIDHGCLVTSPDLPMPERLLAIHGLLDELLSLHEPAIVAVERLFFSR